MTNITGKSGATTLSSRATVETERTAAQRPLECGHQTPVESGKEQGK